MDAYFASSKMAEILEPLKALKDLVVEGFSFEDATQGGEGRFKGNGVHFLKEERFRRMFFRRYPALRDGLVESIGHWEAVNGKKFYWKSKCVRDQLQEMSRSEDELVAAPGDLTACGRLMHLLDVGDVNVATAASATAASQASPSSPASLASASPNRRERKRLHAVVSLPDVHKKASPKEKGRRFVQQVQWKDRKACRRLGMGAGEVAHLLALALVVCGRGHC